ncbi:MAG: 3-deoxy-D-manno-octulosonic acid transferase [Candidatus Omnitrophica bacterium]|nr:3-deoxy-D-manno-octulosonic acid transferase [Candidatus Omnitrophota bacterium]
MRILYDIFFLIFSLAYLPVLIFKRKAHKDFAERFGMLPDNITGLDRPVWIHGVSVGEAAVAVKISAEIKKRYPGIPVVISTTTRTGNDMAVKNGSGAVDGFFYFPLDLSGVVHRVVKTLSPRLFMVVETELWPNLLEELKSAGVPAVLANGRISDRSFSNYKKVKFIAERMLDNFALLCAQTRQDASRLVALGASADRVKITGNMKFDGVISDVPAGPLWPSVPGKTEKEEILVAGSTHFPEENSVIDAYVKLRKKRPGLKLVLAPRHIERTEAIGVYLSARGLEYERLSDLIEKSGSFGDVVIVDRIGYLKGIYAMATVVFIGGSLAKKGGQNPIEPASYAKPVIFGPNMWNFRQVAALFIESGAAMTIREASELDTAVLKILEDDGLRNSMGKAALNVVMENAGAVVRTVDEAEKYLVQGHFNEGLKKG